MNFLKSILLLCLLVGLNTTPLNSQSKTIERLLVALDTSVIGSEAYLKNMWQLSESCRLNGDPRTDSIVNHLLSESEKYGYPKYIGDAYYEKAQSLVTKYNIKQATLFLRKAFESYGQAKAYEDQAWILWSLSDLQRDYSSFKEADNLLDEAIQICQKNEYYNTLCLMYSAKGNLHKVIAESFKIEEEQYAKNLNLALYFYEEALITVELGDRKSRKAYIILEMLSAYNLAGKHTVVLETGLPYLASKLIKRNRTSAIKLQLDIGTAYLGLQNFLLARQHLNKALLIEKKYNILDYEQYIYKQLYELALAEQDYKMALDYYQKQNIVQDSLWTQEKQIAFNKMEVEFETRQKELENKKLQQWNQLISLLAGMTLLAAGLFAYFFYQSRKQRLFIQKQKQELQTLDTLKSRFFANVTHELRTPLTLIIAPLQDILTKEKLPSQTPNVLAGVQQNAQKLMTLVEELLDLSRMEGKQLVLKEEKIAFYPFIRRLFAAHTSYAQYRSIDLQFNYEASHHLQVLLDSKKLEKVINNLLSNALKFTVSEDKVILAVEDLGGQLKITVTDTGQGIHQDDLPYIFNRFFQSKRLQATAEGGVGIGLALCKEYVKLFGGILSVESEWGRGSQFAFVLPKKEIFSQIVEVPSFPQQLPISFAESSPVKKGHYKILIVEDNKDMANYIQSVLSNQYEIITADNGIMALKKLKQQAIDLIISDVMMPQMDGFQLLEAVKEQQLHLNKPFIMLTARTATPDRLKALRLGVGDYLTKPFLSEELQARVANLLAHYEAKREYIKEQVKNPIAISFEPSSSADELWVIELEKNVKNNLSDANFNVAKLATLLLVSERTLRTKTKSTIGLSPSAYIREARLAKAHQFLENGKYNTISEITYAIGMKYPTNFTKMYKFRYGKLPSDYFLD